MKAVLFDLDGVLVDSLECWLRAFNETLKKYGLGEIGRENFGRSTRGRNMAVEWSGVVIWPQVLTWEPYFTCEKA